MDAGEYIDQERFYMGKRIFREIIQFDLIEGLGQF
jgi:hypothetical protein